MCEQTFNIKLIVAPEDDESSITKDRLTDVALVAISDSIEAMFPAYARDFEGNEIYIKLLDFEFT